MLVEFIATIEKCDSIDELVRDLNNVIGKYGFFAFQLLDVGHPDLDLPYHVGTTGKASILGFAFDGHWADKNRAAVDRFLAASQKAKTVLAGSADEWKRLAARIGTGDSALLEAYRKRYAEGVPRRPLEAEIGDARSLYRALAEIGGAELVGPARELDTAMFYRPDQGS